MDKNGVIPRYGLQYLRYYLGVEIDARAHDPLGDLLVLEKLFYRLHTKFQENGDLEDAFKKIIRISNTPQWLLTTELDEDMKYTVQNYLKRL